MDPRRTAFVLLPRWLRFGESSFPIDLGSYCLCLVRFSHKPAKGSVASQKITKSDIKLHKVTEVAESGEKYGVMRAVNINEAGPKR